MNERDPQTAEAASCWEISLGRGDWRTRIEASSSMRGDAESFQLSAERRAYDGPAVVHERPFETAIPRELG